MTAWQSSHPAPTEGSATPVQRYPAMSRRLLCAAYEFCLLFGVTFLATYLLLALAQWRWPLDPTRLSVLQVYTLAVVGMYFIYFWGHSGQTLAMKTWRIRLVQASGGRATLMQCCLRYALLWWGLLPAAIVFAGSDQSLYAAATLLACTLFSWCWMWFDRDRQFLHDHLVGTRLVQV